MTTIRTGLARKHQITDGLKQIYKSIPTNTTDINLLPISTILRIKAIEQMYHLSNEHHGLFSENSAVETKEKIPIFDKISENNAIFTQKKCKNCQSSFEAKTKRKEFCTDTCRAKFSNNKMK